MGNNLELALSVSFALSYNSAIHRCFDKQPHITSNNFSRSKYDKYFKLY